MNVKTDTNSYTTTNLKEKKYNNNAQGTCDRAFLFENCMHVTHMLPVLRLHKSTPNNKSTKNVTHGYHH